MDWGILASTALGALIGAGSTTAADRSRWKRDYFSREHTSRREVYAQYLAALSLATHQLRDLQRPGPLTPSERMRKAGEVLSASGAYRLRYQMLIAAPDALEKPTQEAFKCLRKLRDRFNESDVCTDPEWDNTVAAISDAIAILMQAMRDDLSKST